MENELQKQAASFATIYLCLCLLARRLYHLLQKFGYNAHYFASIGLYGNVKKRLRKANFFFVEMQRIATLRGTGLGWRFFCLFWEKCYFCGEIYQFAF